MRNGPIINPADVERLARKLCEAYGEEPDKVVVVTWDDKPEIKAWQYRCKDAERLLRERWATFECWRRNPPALYTGKEREPLKPGDREFINTGYIPTGE